MASLTEAQALEELRRIVAEEGSQAGAARRLHITPAYLHDLLAGNRRISSKVAQRLGYRRVVGFEKE